MAAERLGGRISLGAVMRYWVPVVVAGGVWPAAALGAFFVGSGRPLAGLGFILIGVAAGLFAAAALVGEKGVDRAEGKDIGPAGVVPVTEEVERCEDLVG